MTARRIVLLVVAAAVLSTAGAVGIVSVLLFASPQYPTGDDLLARPEGKLVYPGATQLNIEKHDEIHSLFEAPMEASVIRTLATADSTDAVVAWYHARLTSLGYQERSPRLGYAAFWTKTSDFDLSYGRAFDAAYHPPPGQVTFVTSYSVRIAGT